MKAPTSIEKFAKRDNPTELATGVGLAVAVYGFAAQGLPNSVAVVIGLVAGFGPIIVTKFVQAIRREP